MEQPTTTQVNEWSWIGVSMLCSILRERNALAQFPRVREEGGGAGGVKVVHDTHSGESEAGGDGSRVRDDRCNGCGENFSPFSLSC